MIKHALTALALMVAAQVPQDAEPPITAQSLPAIAEPSWAFVDGNNQYFVGKTSGTVTVIRMDGRPRPAPTPTPQPPPVVVKPIAWATLILPGDRLTPELASLRTDAEIRKAFDAAKITYRSYLDGESDIDRLKFRQFIVAGLSIPQLVLQDKDGAVVGVKSIQDKNGILDAIKP